MAPGRGHVLALIATVVARTRGLEDGLARTPPMGWRSWNLFQDHVDQSLMLRIMDALVEPRVLPDGSTSSYRDVGYSAVGLDDGWQLCGKYGAEQYTFHDATGVPVVNRTRFPDLLALTARAHELGLTAEWYLNNCICADHCASLKCYHGDVAALTAFDFDGVKLDGCSKQLDLDLWEALLSKKPGRKLVVENCHWGLTVPTPSWCPFHFYRTSRDIEPTYASVVANLQTVVDFASRNLSTPGCWAYGDMLEVGVRLGTRGLTLPEARAHFGAWCITSSPLILTFDVASPTQHSMVWDIVSNQEAIAVNQAYFGNSGVVYQESAKQIDLGLGPVPAWQLFFKPMAWDGTRVAVFAMNHAPSTSTINVSFAEVPGLSCASCTVRDVWAHETWGLVRGAFAVDLDAHASLFIVLAKAPAPFPA